jgi:RecJ-like exonuclease
MDEPKKTDWLERREDGTWLVFVGGDLVASTGGTKAQAEAILDWYVSRDEDYLRRQASRREVNRLNQRGATCPTCNGSGAWTGNPLHRDVCPQCEGTGQV